MKPFLEGQKGEKWVKVQEAMEGRQDETEASELCTTVYDFLYMASDPYLCHTTHI